MKLGGAFYEGNDFAIFNLKKQIETIEFNLKNAEYQPFYDEESSRFITFAEYITTLEQNKKQLIFNLREATGEGNYSPIEQWTITDVFEYLELKKQQIEKNKLQYNKNI